MLLKVMERWNLVTLLPEKANLATSLIVDDLRRKLLVDADEMEELGMTTGVVCAECDSPVENRGTPEEPHYYCIICDKFVEDTKGLADRTIWSQAADVGKEVELNKAERSIFIAAFNKLDEADAIEPQHVAAWKMLAEAYPKAFRKPVEDDDEGGEEE